MRVRKEDRAPPGTQRLYGIGEWYGRLFSHLPAEDRHSFARIQKLSKKDRPQQPCPFRSTADRVIPRTKEGGVCSVRLYEKRLTGPVRAIGQLCTVCPKRFEEDGLIFGWIGETILGCSEPIVLGQIGFLEKPEGDDEPSGDVGRIDNVLVVPNSQPLSWCAVEIQAVYFQGASMKQDFNAIVRAGNLRGIPFPAARRQPDYRSSGPKRLMPQLQIKVPSLRRWGKKMAVVIDRGFFEAMGKMETVNHVSNCDVVWFVVDYQETGDRAKLVRYQAHYTTLERSVEGLTAGVPTDLPTFETHILQKLQKR
jgi:hypothetical protein